MPRRHDNLPTPSELVAIQLLRSAAADRPLALTGGERQQLTDALAAADPDVEVPDLDDLNGPPLYEGPASQAHDWIPAGTYDATGTDGHGRFRLIVGSLEHGGTCSAALSPAEVDGAALNTISSILEHAIEQESVSALLARVDRVVTSTGRVGAPTELIDWEGQFSQLLDARAQRLDHDPLTRREPEPPDGHQL